MQNTYSESVFGERKAFGYPLDKSRREATLWQCTTCRHCDLVEIRLKLSRQSLLTTFPDGVCSIGIIVI